MSSVKNRNDEQNYINYKQDLNKQKFVKQQQLFTQQQLIKQQQLIRQQQPIGQKQLIRQQNLGTQQNLIKGKNSIPDKFKNILNFNYLKINKNDFNNFENYVKNLIKIKSNAKYNILYVIDSIYLCKKMSRVRFWAIEELSKNQDINVFITGPGFNNFNNRLSLQHNILNLNINFNLIIWYKPLNKNYNFDYNFKLPFKTCLRYNEMWDINYTMNEIDKTKTDIIICHHKNDYLKYLEFYKNNDKIEFNYIPHFSNPNIFKNLNIEKKIDILISGILTSNHYPLKHRLSNIIINNKDTILKKYNIYIHSHPNYTNNNSFQNISQIEYNKLINMSKLCIACTSRYNYRLGKYVEIPMAGSVILGDLPFEDKRFKDFVVEINNSMSDEKILSIIVNTLDNKLYEKKQKIGLEWSSNFTQEFYVKNLIKIIKSKKIFIISDEIKKDHPEFKNQKWICDLLKDEFIEKFPYETTNIAKKADIIWYLAPWNYNHIPNGFNYNEWFDFLKTKKVITTQHHVDKDKLVHLEKQFKFMNDYSTYIHAICDKTKNDLKKYFKNKKILTKHLWINDKNFFNISDKDNLRKKYNFANEDFLIGSFQKDTEGKTNLPKLSKGPDIFMNIVKDMYKTNKNIKVVLTGLRREYLINELNKNNIRYSYYNMISLNEINELYNCLDVYIISSRCEGGPRSVFEAGLTKTPIISTDVGIASELMNEKSIFNYDNWITYKKAEPDIDYLYNNVKKLSELEYINKFKYELFNI